MIRLIATLLFLLAGIQLQAKPNVLIIYTDDQGSIDANCYGAKDLATPNIDKLAKTGVRFTQMLAPSSVCTPSRVGLMTGNIPWRIGLPGNAATRRGGRGMEPEVYTMAELFKDNGYRTAHIGKWHLGYQADTMPNGQGFDYSYGHMGGCIDNYSHFYYWGGPNEHDLWKNGKEVWEDGVNFGSVMTREMKRILSEKDEKPFFLYWAMNWPHYPLQGFPHWREHYKGLPSPRSKYAAFVSSMDEVIGDVLNHLEKEGLREETIVVFQSDHGHSVEERTFGGGGNPGPFRGHKGSLFEAGLRVPSIISWPGHLPQGEVRDQMVTGCDWFPTLAELSGSSIPNMHLDGRSIVDVIRSSDAKTPHPDFFWSYGDRPNASWAVRRGDWKLLGNPKDQINREAITKNDRLFLVNLSNDIGEMKNLAAKNPAKVKELQELKQRYEKSIKTSLSER